MSYGVYHSCKAQYCSRWFPKSTGDFCPTHASTIKSGGEVTSLHHQCSYTEGTKTCTVLTVGYKNGQPLCVQHMFAAPAKQLPLPAVALDPYFDYQSDEEIDWYIYRQAWNTRTWRQGKYPTVDSVHFRFKLKGPERNQLLFHAMLKAADNEYPLDPERKRHIPLEVCTKCGGVFWHHAVPEPDEIKRAAKQAGLKKISILKWLSSRSCHGALEKKIWSHGVAA